MNMGFGVNMGFSTIHLRVFFNQVNYPWPSVGEYNVERIEAGGMFLGF